MRILTSLIAAALFATAATPPVWAAAPFSSKKFVYRADGKKLSDVLQDFAASQDLPIVVDPGVEGTVNAEFNTRAEDFLNAMTRTYGVIWYHDGTTLFVYPSRAMQSKVFRMRGFDRQQVRQMLGSLGLGDARFPLRFDDVQQTLLAYGPPRHLELVTTVLEQLEKDGRDRIGKSIKIFPLRYASAGDRKFGNTTVPGLAATLNNLFSGGATSASNPTAMVQTAVNSMMHGQANKARAMQQNYGVKPEGSSAASPANYLASNDKPPEQNDAEKPYFQADESTNSVIVRGLPDRMQEYGALITQLDAPQDLVEIEASIIDISANEFESLGMDFNFSKNGSTKVSLSSGSQSSSSTGTTTSSSIAGTNITTVLGNAGQQLLARIRALEGTGKAHILSRPKVLGAVNRMASMVDKRVASVKVSSNLDAQLFTVEAGTTLQVTPQIVNYADHRKVRLSLSIQDGNFEGTVVDEVPIVKQTEINTEATIREGESLLIGGISVESDNLSRTGIPYLSNIPGLGFLFRHTEGEKVRSERLFLLTPKVITVGGAAPLVNAVPATPQTDVPSAAPAALFPATPPAAPAAMTPADPVVPVAPAAPAARPAAPVTYSVPPTPVRSRAEPAAGSVPTRQELPGSVADIPAKSSTGNKLPARSSDSKASDAKPADSKASDVKPADSKASDSSKAADSRGKDDGLALVYSAPPSPGRERSAAGIGQATGATRQGLPGSTDVAYEIGASSGSVALASSRTLTQGGRSSAASAASAANEAKKPSSGTACDALGLSASCRR